MKDLRLEITGRNNVLWHAIHANHKNVDRFSMSNNFNQGQVGDILNFKMSPYRKNGEVRKIAKRLCELFNYEVDDLFPPHLYNNIKENKAVLELQGKSAIAYHQSLNPARKFGSNEREKIELILNTLSPREKYVIEERFGLNSEAKTLEKIAIKMCVTRERVRQIECKAVRKLRHPGRAILVKDFIID